MKPIQTRADVEEMLRNNVTAHPLLKDHGQKTLNTITEAVELLRLLVSLEPCRYDHNGFCQEHYSRKPCSDGQTQAFLARYEGKEQEGVK